MTRLIDQIYEQILAHGRQGHAPNQLMILLNYNQKGLLHKEVVQFSRSLHYELFEVGTLMGVPIIYNDTTTEPLVVWGFAKHRK